MTNSTAKNRVERTATLRWVPLGLMCVSPLAQRELNEARVDKMAASFDPELIGTPTVSHRDGKWFIVDGQHRVETMRAVGWGDQQIHCWSYEGLTEGEEAEMYLSLNDTLAQSAFDKFRIAVVAQREMECDIYRIVHSVGLSVTRDRIEGGVRAVGTLVRVYKRGGPKVLKRTLTIIRDAYGTPGLEAQVIDGIGFLCDRYNGDLEDQLAVAKLSNIHGGVNGLLNKAEVIRRQTGQPLGQSVAAAAVEVINHGLGPRSSKRLSSWFREEAA